MTTTDTHVNDLAKEVRLPAKGTLSRTLFGDGRLKAALFDFAWGVELSPSARSIRPPNGASHPTPLHVSESLRGVYPGTARGGFETPELRLDKDHDVRIFVGQFLLGQPEARFCLSRRRIAICCISVVLGGAQVVTPLVCQYSQLLMVGNGVHKQNSLPYNTPPPRPGEPSKGRAF
jgi:hypothetical protein